MAFKVTVQPSGHTFTTEDNETVLEAALRQSIDLPYGCRGGACGACEGQLLSGKVHYEKTPMALSDEMIEDNKALFCKAIAESDLEIKLREVESEIEVRSFRCRVEEKQQLSHDVIALKLKLAGDERLQFHAGQYVEFILEDGKRRAFSIANAPHDDELIELHIRHVPGGKFTDFLFEEMPDKTMLRLDGPHGNFYFREDSDRPILMVGGGTGFGPLKSIIEHAIYVGNTQPIHVFMGVRALKDLYMQDIVKPWIEQHNITFTPVLSEPEAGDNWTGETGYVHESVAKHYADLSGFDIYISGPPVMVNAAADVFVQQSADREHMFSDAFEFSADALKAMGK